MTAQPQASPRRQKRGDVTKLQLIDATKSLLVTEDFHSITLDQISAAVGVAKSSILWHFGSREGLLSEAVFSLFEEVERDIILKKEDLPTLETRVAYLLDVVGRYFAANPHAKGTAISLIFSHQVPPALRERIQEHWQSHIEQITDFLFDVEAAGQTDTAGALMALLHGTYTQWILGERQQDIGDLLVRYCRAMSQLPPV